MHYIHCLNNISHYGTDLLTSKYKLTDDISKASGILVRSASMHEMDFSDNLLAIARAGAGVNNIPLDKCAEAGIVVFNTPGANANAVKEIVLCALLLGSRDIIGGTAWVAQNADDPDIAKAVEKNKKKFAGTEIAGKKIGIIGLGAIGARVANAAVELGMDAYGYDPFVGVDAAWGISSSVKHITNVDKIYRECDYITIHVPAMDSTKGMIGEDAFENMKKGMVVLNFSRDTLVDVEAMAEALENGTVSKYITDFPTPDVLKMKNTIAIPHLGASTAEAEDNCAIMATRQLMDFIENGNIKNSVNFPNCDLGPASQVAGRIGVMHENVPNMISQITGALGNADVNIENMMNKAKGKFAYTLLDLNAPASQSIVAALSEIEGVIRTRIIV